MSEPTSAPRLTALHKIHEEAGATLVDFAGWLMPLRYASETAEHTAVREAAGLFDLSHMGEIRLVGPQAAEALDHALVGFLSKVKVGRARYTMITAEDGGVLDDLIVYRLGEQEYMVVANAANVPVVASALAERAAGFNVEVVDESAAYSLIAIQGPRAVEILAPLTDANLDDIRYYAGYEHTVAGVPVLLARTGYTGEDGFEIFVDNGPDGAAAAAVWDAALVAGADHGVRPCGLAARDTLRLEAGMPLYGNELSRELTPVDAGLGILAATKSKDAFVGREAIVRAKEEGTTQTLVGLTGEGRRAARGGYAVLDADGNRLGEVTSGALSPTLGYPVAMAYVSADAAAQGGAAAEGSTVTVDIRGKAHPYTVVALPFYKREK